MTTSVLRTLLSRRMLICVFIGFSSGMPLYLLISLVPAWLRNNDMPLTVIGLFALAQLPFTWKFLWAPLLDRYSIVSWLGRRRSWMFVTQVGLIASIAWLGQVSLPDQGFPWYAFSLACVIALLSATQDIALDAFRREILPDAELGLGNSIHVNAYRIAGLVPGSLALILADKMPWEAVFIVIAAFMLPGLAMTLLVREPSMAKGTPRTLRAAVVEPFTEFFGRHGVKSALVVLLFLCLYKLGDSLCSALATPFYLDMGFSNTEIGVVAKNAGLWTSLIGGILGGIWMIRLGINRALWLFGVVQVVSTVCFAVFAWIGPPFVAPKEHSGLSPDAFVHAVTNDVFAHACANKKALEGNARNARALLDNSARRYFNFNRMTHLAVDFDWETPSGERARQKQREQQKQLTDAFHTVLVHTWADVIIQHCDWRIEIDPPHVGKKTQDVTVNTVMRRDGQAIRVDYSLEKIENHGENNPATENHLWKVFDITVDGQSITKHYRPIFSDELRTAGITDLIKWLQKQVVADFMALLLLGLVVAFEALGVGLGTAAFVAFMARTTNPVYTATQFALFTSLMAIPRTFVNASAGWLVEGMGGWMPFFWFCSLLAIPGMLLLFKVAPWNSTPPATPTDDSSTK